MFTRVIDSTDKCYSRVPEIIPADTTLRITSFILTAGGEGFDGDLVETTNYGVLLSPSSINILKRIRPGSFLEISCIKAYNKAGHQVILNTYFREF